MTIQSTTGPVSEVALPPSGDSDISLSDCVGYRVDSLEAGPLGVLREIRDVAVGGTCSDLIVSMGRHIGRAWLIPANEVDVVLHPTRQIVVRSSHQLFRSTITRMA